jgi:hypothetical protein
MLDSMSIALHQEIRETSQTLLFEGLIRSEEWDE